MSNPKVIGLLGGAFDPAHAGHVHISRYAMTALPIEAVWWLVSYNHPVKGKVTDFTERFQIAKTSASPCPFITVSDFERRSSTAYSIETILALKKHYPEYRFIWMIGADNLTNLHTWHRWKELLDHISIAILNRGNQKEAALSSPFANTFSYARVLTPEQLRLEAPFSWYFCDSPLHKASSSALREGKH